MAAKPRKAPKPKPPKEAAPPTAGGGVSVERTR